MLKNYFKIAIRNIFRHKIYSSINIAGLALGLTCSIFILLWVRDELSYDRHFKSAENLYRVEEDQYYSGETYHVNVTPFPCAPAFKEEIPEVVNAGRITWHGILLRNGDKAFYETEVVAVDQEYLDMFGIKFLQGDPAKALIDPHTIVLTKEMAEKYFGDENPVGQTLSLNNQYEMKVTGIIEDLPHNTSFTFKGGFPFIFLKELGRWGENWGSNSIFTFVELQPNSNLVEVDSKLTAMLRAREDDSTTDYMVAPLTRMHLYAYWGYGKPAGAIQYVYIFSIIALFVLLIACINFMNLSTARSANRAKEIGMRKVVGAKRSNLIKQFFGESLILAFIGMFFSLILVVLLLGEFNDFADKQISYTIFLEREFIAGILTITILTGFVAGTYPALFLSSFKPVKILKGAIKTGAKNSVLRRVLVVFQFSLSVFLIVGTLVIYNQLKYMQGKSLGFDKEQVLYISMRGDISKSYEAIKSGMNNTTGVLDITGSSNTPHQIGSNSGGARWDGKDPEQHVLIGVNVVDYNFCNTMKIEMSAGRDFSEEFTADIALDSTGNFIVNEEVAKVMGKTNEQAVGASFSFMGVSGQIVGVMKNFHFNSVRNKIEPLAMALAPEHLSYMVVRIAPGEISETISNMRETWSSVLPTYPFEYNFMDDDFARMYMMEERMVDLLKYFSFMAIVIACLGLFGLASFTAEQRKKEIGIRKVLGAGEIKLTYLMCREFLILTIISAIIAWPVSYFALESWLEKFAYRIDLTLWTFILSGIISLVIALSTVGYQAIKAAIANPVESLRYE